MEKKPIFGRLILVVIIGLWAFFQWYPPQGKDLLDAFKVQASKKADTAEAAAKVAEALSKKITDDANKEEFEKVKAAEDAATMRTAATMAKKELVALFDRLDRAKADLKPGTELTLDAWKNAIGESTDLRNYFPNLLFPKDNEVAKARMLEELKLSTNSWSSPNVEQQSVINRAFLAKIQKEARGKVKLGLDLRGGTQFVVQVKPKEDPDNPGEFETVTASQLTQAMEIMRRRVDTFGVSEPLIQTSGEDKIIIQVPGLGQADRDRARNIISQVAQLDFRLSHPDSKSLIDADEPFVPGAERMSYEQENKKSGGQIVYEHFIEKEVALKGSYIKSATVLRNDQTGVPEIHFTLDPIGANKFAKITERHRVGNGDERLLAIVVDGKLVSAASININGRFHTRGQITGVSPYVEAMTLPSPLTRPSQFSNDESGGRVLMGPSVVRLSGMPFASGTIGAFNPLSISINGRFRTRGQITGDLTLEEATALTDALENQPVNQVLLIEEKDLK